MRVTRSALFWKGTSPISLAETGVLAARRAELPSLGLVRSSRAALSASPFSISNLPGLSRSLRWWAS